MKIRFLFLFLVVFNLMACAWLEPDEEKSAKELAKDGMESFEKGRYQKSVDAFEQLKDWYPFSKYAILAELKIADAYFEMDEYEDAIFAYREFEELHPSNEAIPYVIYQRGNCYFLQVDTVDRDQLSALKALDSFNRLQRQFPESDYAKKAKNNIHTCIKSIVGHEFYVAKYYFKSKHYQAALKRFEGIITNYPDFGFHRKALSYMAKCQIKIKKQNNNYIKE